MVYLERKEALAQQSHEALQATVLDDEYNDFMRQWADYGERDEDPRGHGKRIPYIGWFWRQVSFFEGWVRIGDSGEFIGFMESNKWDYPERRLTPEEFHHLMELIDAARSEAARGGVLSEIHAKTEAKLCELWDWMQTLKVAP